MRPHPAGPVRECEGGCGKRKRSHRPWTCFRCVERDRQLNRGESLRDFRKRLPPLRFAAVTTKFW